MGNCNRYGISLGGNESILKLDSGNVVGTGSNVTFYYITGVLYKINKYLHYKETTVQQPKVDWETTA